MPDLCTILRVLNLIVALRQLLEPLLKLLRGRELKLLLDVACLRCA